MIPLCPTCSSQVFLFTHHNTFQHPPQPPPSTPPSVTEKSISLHFYCLAMGAVGSEHGPVVWIHGQGEWLSWRSAGMRGNFIFQLGTQIFMSRPLEAAGHYFDHCSAVMIALEFRQAPKFPRAWHTAHSVHAPQSTNRTLYVKPRSNSAGSNPLRHLHI